jgi:hypothetical protein
MLGIPREVIEHKLGIDPSYKSVKQKERRYTLERCKTIRKEYPSWLANPILVEKPDDS